MDQCIVDRYRIVKFDIDLKIYEENISEEIVYVYSKGDYEKLKLILLETDWSQISLVTNINECWTKFVDILRPRHTVCLLL